MVITKKPTKAQKEKQAQQAAAQATQEALAMLSVQIATLQATGGAK